MKTHRLTGTLTLLLAALAIAACQKPAGEALVAAQGAAAPDKASAKPSAEQPASAGKPSAPLTIDYDVIGTPLVGQPVSIDLRVTTAGDDQPVTLSYGVVDTTALSFPAGQTERMLLGRVNRRQPSQQQVTVVPQREGRLYLNVSAEIQTANGVLLKSIAIPIQVGSAPAEREVNGELTEDAAGEAIESMPAGDKPPPR